MGEYYNKEYYNKIKGNCAYIELVPDNIKSVMRALYNAGIPFSAAYGGYRNVVTVHNDNKQRAFEIANANRGVNKANQRIIGNTEYNKIKDRHYINTTPEIALQVSAILSGDSSIKFSGVLKEKSATLTVSGAKNAEMVNRIIDNVRNADILDELSKAGFERMPDNGGFVIIRNTATGEASGFKDMAMVRAMFGDVSNEFFHAPAYKVDKAEANAESFYISDTDGNDERNIYIDNNGEVPMFPTEEAAEQYAENNNISLEKADVPVEQAAENSKIAVIDRCYDRLKTNIFENETVKNALANSDYENASTEIFSLLEREALNIFNEDIYGNIDFYADFFAKEKSERRTAFEEFIDEAIVKAIETRDNSAVSQEMTPEFREVPLYTMSYAEAAEEDEGELSRLSAVENRDCTHTLNKYIDMFYGNDRLDTKAVLDAVLAEFPEDRVEFIIAVNIAGKNWDARYSRENIEWADNLMSQFSDDFRKESTVYHLTAHAGLINLMGTAIHKYMEQQREAERISKKAEEVITLRQQFVDKIQTDLANFLANPNGASEYQINTKKDIADFIIGNSNYDFSETQYNVLLSRPHLLSELYEEWRSNDIDEWDEENMITFLSDTAAFIAESIEREKENPALEKAKAYITEYLADEFGSTPDFSHLNNVSIGYTELGENNEYPFRAEADLLSFEIRYWLAGEMIANEIYDSLEEMNEKALSLLDFNDITAIGNNELDVRNSDEVAKALDLDRNHITFSVITIEDEKPIVMGTTYVDDEDIYELDEYRDYILETGKYYADVTVNFYDIGNDEAGESYSAENGEAAYIQEHLNEVINHSSCINLETNNFSVKTPEFLLEEFVKENNVVNAIENAVNEIEWKPILESEDENGRITSYAANVDGTLYWISQNPEHRYDIETSIEDEICTIRDGADFTTRADAEEYFNEYIAELKEQSLNNDEIRIYQVKPGEEYHYTRFAAFDELKEAPNIADYDLVYTGSLSDIGTDNLEEIYAKFNIDRSEDFKGHSLSVSDVLAFRGKIYYVDSVGFKSLSEQFFEKRKDTEKALTEDETVKQLADKTYTPALGDKFIDKRGEEWELVSLTGVMPWYTDQCTLKSVSSGFSVTKNESYTNLFDNSKYELVSEIAKTAEYTPKVGDNVEWDGEQFEVTAVEDGIATIIELNEAFPTEYNFKIDDMKNRGIKLIESGVQEEKKVVSDDKPSYVPKIGDLIDMKGSLLTVSDISGSVITFTDSETLFQFTSRMALADFFAQDFKVVQETVGEIAESVPTVDVPLEHQESDTLYTYDTDDSELSKVKLKSIVIDLSESSEQVRKEDVPVEQVEEKAESNVPKGQNFVITDENLGVATPKVRYKANIEAIRTLQTIESENRSATPEEQQILSGYTGWGAIPEVFDSSKNDWHREYEELKELLTDEEYAAARKSTLNAHYTSPTVISTIYSGLANLGFESGKVLEPAMGIGNFFGTMPDIMRNSELHGVELDSVSGRIARQLYPNADIQIKGFEQTNFENGSFDVVVGNVPFGDYKVNDAAYNKHKFYIHDYFIAKSIDKVRPGGVLAVVTSKGTMDKESSEMRKYIAQRAELLGAVRLPNNAFKANAGTEVTSDILFFQKRERPIEINPAEVEWLNKAETEDGLSINAYFVNHPEMVLGKIVEGNKLYAIQQGTTSCEPIPGADLKQQLAEAIGNIKGTYTPAKRTEKKKEAEETVPAPPNSRIFSYYAVDGAVYFRAESEDMTKVNLKGDSLKRALAMIEIRDNVRELLDLQLNIVDQL